MRKKASTTIKLVLITSVLASCGQTKSEPEGNQQRVFMRADSTAQYTEVTNDYRDQQRTGGGMGSSLLWFMAFRHLGGGMGYANNNLNPNSVSGTNAQKSAAHQAKRNGFGNTAAASKSSTVGS